MSSIKLYTSIFLIVFVFYPFISTDDDLIRLQTLNINTTGDDSMHGLPRTPAFSVEFQLDRMLEEHDTFQVTAVYAFAVILSFCALICLLTAPAAGLELPAAGGRAPPIAA